MGTITERPVVPVELTGSFTRMRASVMRQLVKASGLRNVSENALEREVTYALRRLKIQKQPMNKAVSVRMMVMIDKETLKDMPARLSKAKQAQWAASALRTAEQVEAMNVAARERLIAEIPVTAAAAKMGAGVAKAVPVVGNLIAAYVQIAGIASTEQALGTASGLAEVENKARVAGSVSLLAATFADTADRLMQAMGITELSAGRSAVLRFIARWAPFGAKVFGVVGAVIGAVCDLREMLVAFGKGKPGLVAAYGLSAIGGILIAIAVGIGAEALPLLLVGALVYLIAQILITKFGDDELATWLKRCIWGRDISNRYKSSQQEMSEMPSFAGV